MLSVLNGFAARRRAMRRRREILERLRESDIIIVTHAKSGRTWLLVMISQIYHLKYGVAASQVIKYDNFHKLDRRIPKMYFTWFHNLVRPGSDGPGCGVDPRKKFIFLFRDPRDVAVSFYFHLHNRSTPVERAHKEITNDILDLSMFDFMLDDRVGVPHIVACMNRWVDEMRELEYAMMVRYEDIHADPCGELGRVMEFVGDPCSPAELRRAVEFASFDNLREKEARRFFATDRLHPVDVADRDTFKVRRGKVGGYRDYLNEGQLAAVDRIIRVRLAPVLGYRAAADQASSAARVS